MIDWKPTQITPSAPPEFAGKRSDSIIMGMVKDVMEFVVVKADGRFSCAQGWGEEFFAYTKTAAEAKRECEHRWKVIQYDRLNRYRKPTSDG